MSHQNRYQTPAYLKKKRKRLIIKISLLSILLVALFVSFIYLFNYEKFQIVAVEISKTQFTDHDKINERIGNILNDKKYFLFKKTNFLFIPKKQIGNSLVNQFLPISGAKVRVDNKIIKVQIEEYNPVAKYCQKINIENSDNPETPPDDENSTINSDGNSSEILAKKSDENPEVKESCFLVNRDGLIFYQINDFDKLDNFNSETIEFRGLNFNENPLSLYYLDSERFDTLYSFADSLSKIDIRSVAINTDNSETFRVKIEEGPDLLIESNDESAETLLNNLKTTIEIEEINEIQFKNLEYIDLRFGKNIYYKIK